jgi:glycosyltransferase involved in cell wall biosynthesis
MTVTIRVLHVLNTLRYSGAEVMLHCAAPLWAEHGVSCEIVAIGEEPGPFAPELAEAGYPIHWIADPRNPRLLPQFAALVRAGQFDVVHLHVERANFWLAMTAKVAGRCGILRSLHAQFSFDGALRVERVVQRALLQRMGGRFVAVAPSVAANEWERFGNRADVILNWVDTMRFAPVGEAERTVARQRLGLGRDCLVITSVGNCAAVKNHLSLIEALSLLRDRRENIVYLHAGDETLEVGTSERDLVMKLGMSDMVHFLGPVARVEEVLNATDLFVMPSLREGLGIAAIEALAAGVPTLLADSPGLRDIAAAVGLGPLPEPTPQALAEEIDRLLSEPPELLRSRALAVSNAVRAQFAPKHGVVAYSNAYTAIAPRRSAARP